MKNYWVFFWFFKIYNITSFNFFICNNITIERLRCYSIKIVKDKLLEQKRIKEETLAIIIDNMKNVEHKIDMTENKFNKILEYLENHINSKIKQINLTDMD